MAPTDIDLDETDVRVLVEIRQDVLVNHLDRSLRREVNSTPERVLTRRRKLLLSVNTQPALRLDTASLPIVDYKAVIKPLLFQVPSEQVHHMQNTKIHAFQCLRPTLVQNRLRN